AGSPGNVVEDDGEVRGIRNHPEVSEHASLGGLVVVRRDDHDAIGAGLLAGLVELNGVGGLVRTTTGDDLGAARRNRLADLDELQLLRVGEGAGLAGGAGDDDAVGTGVDDIIDVLLDVVPVDLAVGGERGHQGDEHLAERILASRHGYRLPVAPDSTHCPPLRYRVPSQGEARSNAVNILRPGSPAAKLLEMGQ